MSLKVSLPITQEHAQIRAALKPVNTIKPIISVDRFELPLAYIHTKCMNDIACIKYSPMKMKTRRNTTAPEARAFLCNICHSATEGACNPEPCIIL